MDTPFKGHASQLLLTRHTPQCGQPCERLVVRTGVVQILLKSPVLLEEELKAITSAGLANTTFSLHYQSGSPDALKEALTKLCSDVEAAVKDGCEIVIISDRVEGSEVRICSPPASLNLCLVQAVCKRPDSTTKWCSNVDFKKLDERSWPNTYGSVLTGPGLEAERWEGGSGSVLRCLCGVHSQLKAESPPIPTLLAVGALHHHLIRTGMRTETSIVADTAQCVSTHQLCTLIGYGVHAVCPYLAFETARQWRSSPRCLPQPAVPSLQPVLLLSQCCV